MNSNPILWLLLTFAMFPLDCTSFFKFHLATLVVLLGDLVLFSLLLLYLIYHAISYMSTYFLNFFYFFIFLSINCVFSIYFSDNLRIISIIPTPHQESSSA